MATPKFYFLLLITFFSLRSHGQTPSDVISKYIAYIGGEDSLGQLRTMRTSGTYNYGGMLFPFITYAKAPNRYKVVVGAEDKKFVQAYDGKMGWKMDGFNNEIVPVILHGEAARAMMNEADVEMESPLIACDKKGYQTYLEGKDTVNSRVCFRLKLLRLKGEMETYFFDCETYELVMKMSVSKNSEMNGAIMKTFYSDYRMVNGLRFPHSIVSKIKEQDILRIVVHTIELNVAVSDTEFLTMK